MHIISRKPLLLFGKKHPDAQSALQAWHAEVKRAKWNNPAEVKAAYGGASILKNKRIVFNICGGTYRLIVKVNYMRKAVFVRFIGTHKEYERIDAEMI